MPAKAEDPKALYYRIKKQRSQIEAPVDYYGCASGEVRDPEKYKFRILVALLLSSQTKDEVTYAAVQNLEEKLKEGLSAESILKESVGFIDSCISKVGFHTKKSFYLKKLAEIITKSGMPNDIKGVLSLPGIGYKMAILYLYHACGKVVGISVDTHVHRIANRIGLVETRTPERTRKELEILMPMDEWASINTTLVGFGQVICQPVGPKCERCDVKYGCRSSKYFDF